MVVIGWLTGWLYTKRDVDKMEKRYESSIARLKKAHDEEVSELRNALTLERQRSDVGISAGVILRDIAAELRRGITP